MRPGAGSAAEPPSQLTRIAASRQLQIAVCLFGRPPRQLPCRVGFGTKSPAAQLNAKRSADAKIEEGAYGADITPEWLARRQAIYYTL